MKGLLSILLIGDRYTTGIGTIRQAAQLARQHGDDFEVVVLSNGCLPGTYAAIQEELARTENAKFIKLAIPTDPDLAILEGLKRVIGDHVLIGSVRDVVLDLLPAMLSMAADGHEVVVAQPHYGNKAYSVSRLDYGTRLMTRAAVHFVTHAGGQQRSAYHLLPGHPLFAPEVIPYETSIKPRQSLVRALRRGWRGLIASRVAPLRLVSILAIFGAIANIAYSAYVLGIYVLTQGVAPGWATLSLQSSGMNLLFSLALFVLCEYVINVFRVGHIDQQVRVEREIRSGTVTFDRKNVERA